MSMYGLVSPELRTLHFSLSPCHEQLHFFHKTCMGCAPSDSRTHTYTHTKESCCAFSASLLRPLMQQMHLRLNNPAQKHAQDFPSRAPHKSSKATGALSSRSRTVTYTFVYVHSMCVWGESKWYQSTRISTRSLAANTQAVASSSALKVHRASILSAQGPEGTLEQRLRTHRGSIHNPNATRKERK